MAISTTFRQAVEFLFRGLLTEDYNNGAPDSLKSSNGAAHVLDAVSISGYQQQTLALSSSGAQTAALSGGVYDVWATADCYLKVGAAAGDVTSATGYLLRAATTLPVVVPEGQRIGAVVPSGTATLSLHRTR